MYCPKCGANLDENSNFCTNCGESMPLEKPEKTDRGVYESQHKDQKGVRDRKSLKEELEQLANQDEGTKDVTRYYGANWISKHLLPVLWQGETIVALRHINGKWIMARSWRELLVLTDQRVIKLEKMHFLKPIIKSCLLSEIQSIEAGKESNLLFSTFIGEKLAIHYSNGTIKLRTVGNGAAQRIRDEILRVEPLVTSEAEETYGAYMGEKSNVKRILPERRLMKLAAVPILPLIVVIIAMAGFSLFSHKQAYTKYVEGLRGATIEGTSASIGEAFDSFFGDVKWGVEKTSEKGFRFVIMDGKCYYVVATDDVRELVDATVTFLVEEKSELFVVQDVTIDHVSLSDDAIEAFLEDVYVGKRHQGNYSSLSEAFEFYGNQIGQAMVRSALGHYISYYSVVEPETEARIAEAQTEMYEMPEETTSLAVVESEPVTSDTVMAKREIVSIDSYVGDFPIESIIDTEWICQEDFLAEPCMEITQNDDGSLHLVIRVTNPNSSYVNSFSGDSVEIETLDETGLYAEFVSDGSDLNNSGNDVIVFWDGIEEIHTPFVDSQDNYMAYKFGGQYSYVGKSHDNERERETVKASRADTNEDSQAVENEYSDSILLWKSYNTPLTTSDVENLSVADLRIARNEIFALHGRIFDSSDLKSYFEGKAWYTPTTPASSFNEAVLTEVQKKNVDFIKIYENTGVTPAQEIPREDGCYSNSEGWFNLDAENGYYISYYVGESVSLPQCYDLQVMNDTALYSDNGEITITFDNYGKTAYIRGSFMEGTYTRVD